MAEVKVQYLLPDDARRRLRAAARVGRAAVLVLNEERVAKYDCKTGKWVALVPGVRVSGGLTAPELVFTPH